ncbi:MAG: hypothetical protein U9N06_07290 [candidate division WOR-3 bacterium]|nr:hypothetical protein [candidate division WOR-3 bacterium]
MFSLEDKYNIIDKARRVASRSDPSKAIKILKDTLTHEESDLPLMLEIMHTYHTMDKLNEVIVWAKKAEELSEEASRKVLSEMEDLFYGRGKPDQLAEYLMEKKTEEGKFEEVAELFEGIGKGSTKGFLKREESIVNNILNHKEKYSPRDFTHLYLFSIINEGKDSNHTVEILKKIIEKKPTETERVIQEMRRANQEHYGDERLLFGLGEILLKNKKYKEGISKIKEAMNRNENLQEEVILILSPFKSESREVLDYLSELLIESGREKEALELIETIGTDEAIKKYYRMVKKNPNNPVIHKELAESYLKKGRNSEALKEFLSSVEISPDERIGEKVREIQDDLPHELDNYLCLSTIYKEIGWIDDAVKTLQRGFESFPSNSSDILENLNLILKKSRESFEGLLLKAKLLSKEGDIDQALNIYKKLVLKQDGLEKVKEELVQLKNENPLNTKAKLISLMLQIPEDPEETSREVNLILSQDVNSIPFMLTAYDSWARSKPEFAPQFLKFYESLDKENFPTFAYSFALAELNRMVGSFGDAEKLYIESLDEEPGRFNFLLNHLQKYREKPAIRKIISSLYFYRGEYKKGSREIKSVAKQFPGYSNDIITFLINKIKSNKDNKILIQTLTEILIQNQYYDEAIKWGTKLLPTIELEEQSNLLLLLAKANSEIGNYSESSILARKAVSIDSSLLDKAIAIFEEIREKAHLEPDILMSLYELYKKKLNIKKSITCLEEVINQEPSMANIIADEYEKLIEIAPIDAPLRIHYGKTKLLIGDESGISEIERGLRFDPELKNSVLELLEGIKDPEIESKSILLRAEIQKDLGREKEAVQNFIESYWKNEDKREKAIKGIESLFPTIELTKELASKLFSVYHNEGRNNRLANLVDSFFDGSKERGKYLIRKIEEVFKDNPPLPLQIAHATIQYQIGEKEKSAKEMKDLLESFPEVAYKLREIVNPEDSSFLPLLIQINLELSDWNAMIRYIKQLDLKDRLQFYEKLLDRNPNYPEAIKEAGYLHFILEDYDKAKFCLSSLLTPERREKILLWFLGEDREASFKEIEDLRIKILNDIAKITESPEKRAYLYIQLEKYEKAYIEIQKVRGDKKEILVSLIQLKIGNYTGAYQRLSGLEQTEDVKKLRVFAALFSGNPEISLGLLTGIKMEPARKNKYISAILKDSARKYRSIKPLIRR